jgi:hypothetical protein
VQGRTKIINGLFLNPMMVGRGKCIVLMHESIVVMRVDKFENLTIQLSEMQVERPDGLTIFVSDIIVFP